MGTIPPIKVLPNDTITSCTLDSNRTWNIHHIDVRGQMRYWILCTHSRGQKHSQCHTNASSVKYTPILLQEDKIAILQMDKIAQSVSNFNMHILLWWAGIETFWFLTIARTVCYNCIYPAIISCSLISAIVCAIHMFSTTVWLRKIQAAKL